MIESFLKMLKSFQNGFEKSNANDVKNAKINLLSCFFTLAQVNQLSKVSRHMNCGINMLSARIDHRNYVTKPKIHS